MSLGLSRVGREVGFVLHRWLVLGIVFSPVEYSRGPIKVKLVLVRKVAQLVKTHVHQFGLARHDGVVGNSGGGEVIGL